MLAGLFLGGLRPREEMVDDASRFGNYLGVDSVAPPESGSWHFLSLHIGACSYFLHSPTAHAVGCILRRFATRKIVAPFSRKGSSSDQTAAGTRCRFCGSKPVLKRRAIFGTRLGRWEPRGSSTDLAHIKTLLGSFKIWRFRVCATTFVLRDNNWSRALLGLSGPESRTHT